MALNLSLDSRTVHLELDFGIGSSRRHILPVNIGEGHRSGEVVTTNCRNQHPHKTLAQFQIRTIKPSTQNESEAFTKNITRVPALRLSSSSIRLSIASCNPMVSGAHNKRHSPSIAFRARRRRYAFHSRKRGGF